MCNILNRHDWEELDVPRENEEYSWEHYDNDLFLAFNDDFDRQPWNQHFEVCKKCGASRAISIIPNSNGGLDTHVYDMYAGN